MHWEFVIPGYIVAVVVLGTYVFATVKRGRRLSKQLPEGKRRFLDA